MNGMSTKETPSEFPLPRRRYKEKSKEKRGPSPDQAGTLVLDFQTPERTLTNKLSVVYELLGLWYVVTATQID